MLLNTLQAAEGSRKENRRLGRGRGSGLGKTCGKGHKGQHARAGGYHKVGFEGGQMPIQRRLPKRGFRSKISPTVTEIQLSALVKLSETEITLALLKDLNLIAQTAKRAKIIGAGAIDKAITVKGLLPTAGAKAAIEAAGGQVIA